MKVEEEVIGAEEEEIYPEEGSLDSLRLYFQDIRAAKLLTPEEERGLALRIVQGDEGARKRMIESNLRLVVKVAKRYIGQGLPLLDLIEEGNIGLIKAVEKFKPEKNCRFSTYAILWIRQSIERALVSQTRTVKLPAHVAGDMKRMIRVTRSLTQRLGSEPLLQEVSEEMGVEVGYVNRLMMAVRKATSIETPLNEEEDYHLADILKVEGQPGPFSITEHIELFKLISSWLDLLSPQEKAVIDLRFGLRDGEPKTLEAIGEIFKVTRERIRQIEVKALQRLRKVMEEKDVILLDDMKV
ncbi:MAG: sigma-70 family RNA polymerase sigma factor [Deltaproteobacteria bacterium]|nr:sigma-70 family RNA polymerase sigma factor [Deltaproteobacteria bacterium]